MPLPIQAPKQQLFKSEDIEILTQSIADYLPNGETFIAKNISESKFRRLLKSFSSELKNMKNKIKEVADEWYMLTTTELIDFWESNLGIPDSCFKVDGVSIEQRRKQVVAKFALMNIAVKNDYIDLAKWFGIDIEIFPGTTFSTFPLTFPIIFMSSIKEAKFTMIVRIKDLPEPSSVFPLTFPITFGDDPAALIRCLFEKLKPANVQIIWQYESAL